MRIESDDLLTIEKPVGRRKCPNCGEEKRDLLHEFIDKTNIISDYPRVYGKKYQCGSCGTKWHEK